MTARPDALNERQREKLYAQWRQLLMTGGFSEFLKSEGLQVIELYPEFPHDDAAEMSVIGGIVTPIMEGEELAGELADIKLATIRRLSHLHFYRPMHQVAFRAIRSVFESHKRDPSEPIDIVTVGAQLRRTSQSVGAGYLGQCMESCPAIRSIPRHASIILESAKLRAIYRMTEGIQSTILRATHDGGNYDHSETSEPIPIVPEALMLQIRDALKVIEERSLVDLKKIFPS